MAPAVKAGPSGSPPIPKWCPKAVREMLGRQRGRTVRKLSDVRRKAIKQFLLDCLNCPWRSRMKKFGYIGSELWMGVLLARLRSRSASANIIRSWEIFNWIFRDDKLRKLFEGVVERTLAVRRSRRRGQGAEEGAEAKKAEESGSESESSETTIPEDSESESETEEEPAAPVVPEPVLPDGQLEVLEQSGGGAVAADVVAGPSDQESVIDEVDLTGKIESGPSVPEPGMPAGDQAGASVPEAAVLEENLAGPSAPVAAVQPLPRPNVNLPTIFGLTRAGPTISVIPVGQPPDSAFITITQGSQDAGAVPQCVININPRTDVFEFKYGPDSLRLQVWSTTGSPAARPNQAQVQMNGQQQQEMEERQEEENGAASPAGQGNVAEVEPYIDVVNVSDDQEEEQQDQSGAQGEEQAQVNYNMMLVDDQEQQQQEENQDEDEAVVDGASVEGEDPDQVLVIDDQEQQQQEQNKGEDEAAGDGSSVEREDPDQVLVMDYDEHQQQGNENDELDGDGNLRMQQFLDDLGESPDDVDQPVNMLFHPDIPQFPPMGEDEFRDFMEVDEDENEEEQESDVSSEGSNGWHIVCEDFDGGAAQAQNNEDREMEEDNPNDNQGKDSSGSDDDDVCNLRCPCSAN